MKNNIRKAFKHSLTAVAVTVSLGLAVPAFATTNGYITGQSVQQGGGVLGSVKIDIKNVDTGLSRTVVSGANGVFRFPLLPPGTYDIAASKNGYQQTAQKGVVVSMGGKVSIDLTLTADDIERIEVIRGPGSALYGSNAFLGVLNIITQTSDKQLTISLGENGYQQLSTSFQATLSDALRLHSNISAEKSDGQQYTSPLNR